MLRIAGILTPLHPKADPIRHDAFRRSQQEEALNLDVDAEDKKDYGKARKTLREHTIEPANAIIIGGVPTWAQCALQYQECGYRVAECALIPTEYGMIVVA